MNGTCGGSRNVPCRVAIRATLDEMPGFRDSRSLIVDNLTARRLGRYISCAAEERMGHDAVHVLIASPLEPELAARIAAVDPQVTVLYEPGLLPVPRYPADHSGTPRDLSAADLDRWSELRRQADVSLDF